jgi:uncharacterized protein
VSTGTTGPTTTRPVTEGLFGEDDDGNPYLIGGTCRECGRVQFPNATTCPACGAAAIDEVHLPDHGTLWGWTAVTAPPPGYLGTVPFGFGVVELDGGLRVITLLGEADPARLEFAMPMKLVIAELGPDDEGTLVTTYAFNPAVAS